MLTTDLVRCRRRKGRIEITPIKPQERARMLGAAKLLINIAHENAGSKRHLIEELWNDIDYEPTDFKVVKGLRKLVEDRCVFEATQGVDAVKIRELVFTSAAKLRRGNCEAEQFDSSLAFEQASKQLGLEPEAIELALFADLKKNHLLTSFKSITPEGLLSHYEMSQKQAVLLRSVRVVVKLNGADPGAYRLFFRQLKFRRLLYQIEPLGDGGFKVCIDGPFSLLRAVTKYGLQLALLLPYLEGIGKWELEASVLWGKQRTPYDFALSSSASATEGELPRLPDDVEALRQRFERLNTPWAVDVSNELLDLPGVGLCVPDLVFRHEQTNETVCFEVMGYWSREAVWKRVELVEKGLEHRVIFAVSERLRVCESVLDSNLPGQLYVYKGVMNAKEIARRLVLFE